MWNRVAEFRCPFEPSRCPVWSRNAHFKYLSFHTKKTEAFRWGEYTIALLPVRSAFNDCIISVQGVPVSSIPTHVRASSPEVASILEKPYKDLLEADCIFLLNVHLDHVRRQSEDRNVIDVATLLGELRSNVAEELDEGKGK